MEKGKNDSLLQTLGRQSRRRCGRFFYTAPVNPANEWKAQAARFKPSQRNPLLAAIVIRSGMGYQVRQ